MGDFACFGVFLAIAAFLCGPIALIVSINAMNKIRAMEEEIHRQKAKTGFEPLRPMETPPAEPAAPLKQPEIIIEERTPAPIPYAEPEIARPIEILPAREEPVIPVEPAPVEPSLKIEAAAEFTNKMKEQFAAQKLSLELFLGTRGLAIAGSIAVLVGVIIGLKYLYDMKLITPLGRTLIVAAGGIAALIIGQVTRKRGYGIVATALAALGFAMLYAADFAAFAFYHIIGTNPAFALAIIITAAGMLYAVRLNEIIIAFISLLGGFLSPVVLSTGQNRPNTLFSYLLILIAGAMVCAAVRKWRSVSRLSFIGTAILYSAWFYKWYQPAAYNPTPDQLPVAVTWLCIFFLIYLVMPVLYELIKREIAHEGDVLLLLTNATFTYLFFHQILFTYHRSFLALAALCLGAAHLGLMAVVHKRSPNDKVLKLILLALGLFFITIAIPLYLKMYAVALAWTGEGIVLTLIAFRYRSQLVQLASFVALALAVYSLNKQLPMHHDEFMLVFNKAFGSWCFVAAAYYLIHLFYRREKDYSLAFSSQVFAQIFYCFSLALLLIAACLEWRSHTYYNLVIPDSVLFGKGLVSLLAAFMVISLLPRFRPQGVLPYIISIALGIAALITTIIYVPDFYKGQFTFVFNSSFGTVVFVAFMYCLAHLFYRFRSEELPPIFSRILSQIFYCTWLAALLLAACMEWYGHTTYNFARPDHIMFMKGFVILLAAFMVLYLVPRLRPQGLLPYFASSILAIITFAITLASVSDFYKGPFTFIANSSLGSVAFVAAAFYAAHLLHRHPEIRLSFDESGYFSQILFCMSLIILMAAAITEWYAQTQYNLIATQAHHYDKWFIKGLVVIGSVFVILFILPVFRPKGLLPVMLSMALMFITSIGTLIAFNDFYRGPFRIFANAQFTIGLAPLISMAISAYLLYRQRHFSLLMKPVACAFGLSMIFFLWLLLTEEIYLYWNYPGHPTLASPIDKAQMWISITWAIYAALIIGIGLWHKFVTMRYIGLCFFTIVLLKVFIFDMSTLEKIYRIAGFIVLGLILIGVSYLYQYLRKIGFFEKSSSDVRIHK